MKKKIVTTKNLKKIFVTKAAKIEVLKGIDFFASQGEIIAITGASGVGKSTFLHILGTLESPTEGEVIFDFDGELNPFRLPSDQISHFRNRHIGFVFQFHYLLPEFNVIENVIMPELIAKELNIAEKRWTKGQIDELKDRAMEILESLGIAERALHRPGELSGGEQQRVAVARALFRSPSIVLADEPTGNLDSKSAYELFELLRKINHQRGTTFIIVTHNETLAKKSDRNLRMVDGLLFEDS